MNSAEVTLPCPACGTAVVPGAPFCGACGSSVSPTARAAAAATARAAAEARAAAGAHAVVLVPATPSRRVLALLVDHLASACVLVTAYVVLVAGSGTAIASASDGAALAAMAGALLLPAGIQAAFVLAQVVWEGRAGATLGNAALGIRTVAVATGRPPGFGRAVGRRFIEGLGSLVLVGSYIVAGSSAWDRGPRRQGWQDKAAGTTMVTAASAPGRGSGGRARRTGRPVAADRPPAPTLAGASAVPWPPVAIPRPAGGVITEVPGVGPEPIETDDGAVAASGVGVSVVPPAPARVPAQAPAAEPWPGAAAWAGFPGSPSAEAAPAVRATPPTIGSPTMIVEVPQTAATSQSAAMPPLAPANPMVRPGAVDVPEVIDHTRAAPPRPLHAGAYTLAFDTGEALTVTGNGLVGRNPAPAAGEVVDHVIPISDPDRTVSKTHLAFGVGPDGLWVLDRGSTNGTWTVTGEGARAQVAPGTRVTVPVGSTVEFGDRSFTVSAP